MPIKMEMLEHKVADAVRSVLGSPSNTRALIQILQDEKSKLQSGCADQLQQLLSKKRDVRQQLDRATEAILNGLSSKTLLQKITDLEMEEESINHRISQLKHAVDSISVPNTFIEPLIETISKDDAAILSIVARVAVSKETITIWTILDTDPDGNIDFSDNDTEANSVSVDFIDIVGTGSPAPKKQIPEPGICFFHCTE